jgi:hypothetical protein
MASDSRFTSMTEMRNSEARKNRRVVKLNGEKSASAYFTKAKFTPQIIATRIRRGSKEVRIEQSAKQSATSKEQGVSIRYALCAMRNALFTIP